jgi:hypothetical protein
MLDKIKTLQKELVNLDNELQDFLKTATTPEEACLILSEINFLKRDLSIVYDGYCAGVLQLMGESDGYTLENGAEIERKSGYDRKAWKHKDLGAEVVDKLISMSVDMDTGEVTKSTRQIALEILDYCAPSYWRIKELGKIGVNPDNYCEVGELKTSLIVRKSKN